MKFDWQRLFCGPWIQNAPTNWEWDDLLNKSMDKYPVERVSPHNAKIGNLTVWVGNWPYAYGSCDGPIRLESLPSVATRKRLRAALDFDLSKFQGLQDLTGE